MWVTKFTDHSYWNDIRDWKALRDLGVDSVLLRASSGGTYIDPKFSPYFYGAKKVGFKVLAYHVNHPLFSALANFVNFQRAVAGFAFDGKPVLDNQLTGSQSPTVIKARTRELFQLFDNSYGGAINYTAKWWWDANMGVSNTWVTKYPLLVANYWLSLDADKWPEKTAYTSYIPTDYKGQTPFAWQFSAKGKFPTVSPGSMDKNVGYSRYAETVLGGDPVPPESSELLMRTLQNMNVRSGPGSGYLVVGTVPIGTVIEPIGIDGADCWMEIDPGRWIAVRIGSTIYCKRV